MTQPTASLLQPATDQPAPGHGATRVDKVFVVGNSRSGTTMLARALGRHPAVFTFEELHFFEEQWQADADALATADATALVADLMAIQRHNYYYRGDADAYRTEAAAVVATLDGARLPSRVFAHWLRHEAARADAAVACLQTPRNVYYLDEILALYPDAVIINIMRDPRAVLLSQKGRWKGKFSGERRIPLRHILRTFAGYHPVTIGLLWRGGIRAGLKHREHPRVQHVRFEDLVTQPAAVLRQLSAFIGVPFDPAMLDVPQVNSSNRPNQSHASGIDPTVAERWRDGGLSHSEIYLNQLVTRAEMHDLGYTPLAVRPNPLGLLYHLLSWAVKLPLALLLNAGRMGSFWSALRRRLTGG